MKLTRQIAESLKDYLAIRHGKTYNTAEIEPESISKVGLVGSAPNGAPSEKPAREGEPIARLFAVSGRSLAITELGNTDDHDGNPYDLIRWAFTRLPENTQAVALWAQATMRAIPSDLAPEFDAGASPNQPSIWQAITDRGEMIECDQVVVMSFGGMISDSYLTDGRGRIRCEIDEAEGIQGQMPHALGALLVTAEMTNSIYARVRAEMSESTADQFAEIDEMLERVRSMVEGETTEPPTDERPTTDPKRKTAEEIIAEVRRRTADLDADDLDKLKGLVGNLDEIAEAMTDELGLGAQDLAEIARAFGIVANGLGMTTDEAEDTLRRLGLDD